jgi:hypothetical protein
VVIALIIPGAGAVTYWEQSQTGVFRLGLLNQVESLTVLSIALTVSAIFGTSVWTKVSLFGIVDLQHAMLIWTASTILFGKARSMWRVGAARGVAAVLPIACLLTFGGAIVGATALGVVNTLTAVALCTGANVYFGMRMLSHRLHGESPRIEGALVGGTLALIALMGSRQLGYALSPLAGPLLAAVVCGTFGLYAIGDTRRSIVHLATTSAR